jgi:hypothetical protein
MPIVVTGAVMSASGRSENHHTIPEYSCGASNQQLVALDVLEHRELHYELYGVGLTIDIAGFGLDRLIFKRPGKTRPLQRLAYKRAGRMAIIAGLEIFYKAAGYWDSGLGTTNARGRKLPGLGTTIGDVFPKEAVKFIAGRTSLPACKKGA